VKRLILFKKEFIYEVWSPRLQWKLCLRDRNTRTLHNAYLHTQPRGFQNSLNSTQLFIQGIHKIMALFQKLIKNLFLSLHGHNIHCQQRKLPRFSYATSRSLLMLTAGPRDHSPRWRPSRITLFVCSVLRCPDLWLLYSVNFMHGLKKTHHTRIKKPQQLSSRSQSQSLLWHMRPFLGKQHPASRKRRLKGTQCPGV
jgi:hypothetical protein